MRRARVTKLRVKLLRVVSKIKAKCLIKKKKGGSFPNLSEIYLFHALKKIIYCIFFLNNGTEVIIELKFKFIYVY